MIATTPTSTRADVAEPPLIRAGGPAASLRSRARPRRMPPRWPPIDTSTMKKPSSEVDDDQRAPRVCEKRTPWRCSASVAAAASPNTPPDAPPVNTFGSSSERAGRATEHRHDVEQREPRVAGRGFEEHADLVQDEHVERDVEEPVVHDRVRDEPVVLAVVRRAGPNSARSNDVRPRPSKRPSRSADHDVRDDRAGDDRLGDPRRRRLRRATGVAPVRSVPARPRARTRSSATRPTPGSGSRGTPDARSACTGARSRDPGGGNRSSVPHPRGRMASLRSGLPRSGLPDGSCAAGDRPASRTATASCAASARPRGRRHRSSARAAAYGPRRARARRRS